INTGGIGYRTEAFEEHGEDNRYYPKFSVKARALVDKLPQLHSLIDEVITNTDFSDDKRLREIIQETKSRIEQRIQSQGHLVVAHRLYSYFSPIGHYLELLNGISYYKFLEAIDNDFENKKKLVQENLEKVYQLIFNKNQLLISVTTEDKDYEIFAKELPTLIQGLSEENNNPIEYQFDLSGKNEGFMTSSEVQYVGKGYNFKKPGHHYSGTLQVLRTILSYDYLWNSIRVQGGAYGAFFNAGRDGNMYLGSYRDPNLVETLEAYDGTPEYLKNFSVDDREMRKYI